MTYNVLSGTLSLYTTTWVCLYVCLFVCVSVKRPYFRSSTITITVFVRFSSNLEHRSHAHDNDNGSIAMVLVLCPRVLEYRALDRFQGYLNSFDAQFGF